MMWELLLGKSTSNRLALGHSPPTWRKAQETSPRQPIQLSSSSATPTPSHSATKHPAQKHHLLSPSLYSSSPSPPSSSTASRTFYLQSRISRVPVSSLSLPRID